MRLYTLILFSIIYGCAESNSAYDDKVEEKKEHNNFIELDSGIPIWVCNHPDTKYHNKPCIEEEYPDGCYIEGDNGKFCWLLTKDDCEEDFNRDFGWAHLCR